MNALAFLKSRPQIAAMNNTRPNVLPVVISKPLQSAEAAPARVEESNPAQSKAKVSGTNKFTAFDPESDSWEQQHETILQFLRRLPVGEPDTARVGPWLWVQCPRELQTFRRQDDLVAFMDTTEPLLDGLSRQRVIIEQQNPGKAVGTITRKMNPYRDQLQVDLLNAATKRGVTSGKWMLFPKLDDLPRVWRQVAEATSEGKLGPTSKVGTWEPDSPTKGTLICVYTKDFSELADVKRVLDSLHDLNIVSKGVTIYYKCDAYTHLEIMSGNKYKLQPSLYSSEEVRNDKVKYKDGTILRLKTKSGAMEEFLNS